MSEPLACAITFVYNESVNLPIWRRYYGNQFGAENLFIIDDGSDDGSTNGAPNVIRLPRGAYDAPARAEFVSAFCRAMLTRYETVIYTDCDEFVVADPARYAGLRDFLAARQFGHLACIGLNPVHILAEDYPLDTSRPILAQRRYALFRSSTSKPAVIRYPLRWSPGFHSCDRAPAFDPDLFLFHLAQIDYGICMNRHRVNMAVAHPEGTPAATMGGHWRYDTARFVRETFHDPANVLSGRGVQPFDFEKEITAMVSRATNGGDFHHIPMDIGRLVEIPERFHVAF